jgi:DNA-binding transcriptional LysR family regulator
VRRSFPGSDLEAMSTAVWALVHGLAFLCLDGKLDSASAAAVSGRVRAAVHALLEVSGDELGSSEPMELRHLEHFVAIAQEGSFTQAAKRLHLSQSALSISIRALEKDLGARLFERTSHEVALSDAGRALLPEARRILSDVDVARAAVGDVGSGLRGVFRVGVMQALPLVDLAEILARFHAERPLVEIRPRPAAGGSAALAEDVSKGELDAAFVCLPGGAPADVTLTPLAAEPIRLVCRPDHPLTGRTPVAISELEKEGFVDFPVGFGTREAVDMEFARAGVERIVKVEVPDLTTMIELTRAGIGLATLPLSLLVGRGRLAVVDLEPAPPFEIALALPSARPVKAATQAFLDVVAEMCPGMGRSR